MSLFESLAVNVFILKPTCFSQEFLAESGGFFSELQKYSNGILVNRALCELLIDQLKKSIKFNSSSDNPQA